MADVDPAKSLKEFQPKHKFFVGIDSDGSVFDTMGIKQRECFCLWLIAYFGPHEEKLIVEFDSCLPELPPWQQKRYGKQMYCQQ